MNRFKTSAARVNLAREIAGESMILLKNDGLLPLKAGSTAAVFGKGQVSLYIGGSGSGASSARNATKLVDTLKADGLKLIPRWNSFILRSLTRKKKNANGKNCLQNLATWSRRARYMNGSVPIPRPEEEQKIRPSCWRKQFRRQIRPSWSWDALRRRRVRPPL